jgi:predicted SAM-dependent methyltransferase
MGKKILNLAAGKMPHLDDIVPMAEDHFIVNLDTMYFNHTPVDEIESVYMIWKGYETRMFYCKEDAFEFMERTQMIFDVITIYRFLEHVSFTQLLYFIYLLSTCLKKGGVVDVIVPNYHTLAGMLLNENVDDRDFEEANILLTTELLNEPSAPHASIWTPQRANYFFEYEGRFIVHARTIDQHFVYDGRNIYLRFQAERL